MKLVKALAKLALVAACVAEGARGQSTIALVQHANKDAGTGTSTSLAFKAANTAGNWIGVSVRGGHSDEIFTITDSRGNAYRQAVLLNVTVDVPSGNTLGIFYAENIAGGANTITVSETISGTMRIAIFEYSGVATTNSLDVVSAAQGNGLSPNSGNATTTASGDLLLGAASTANSASVIAGSGFAAVESVPAAPNTKLFAEQEIQSVAGSVAAKASMGAGDGWGAVLAAFRAAGGAGPVPNIASITPASGPVGTPVTIVGTNFGTAVGMVTFNGTPGTPTSWSATRVVVPVPSGATSGNLVLTDPGVPSNPVPFAVTPSDTTAPAVSVTAPANNAVVSGSIPLTATATDSGGSVAFVQFQVDGTSNGGQLASAPYNSSLDTTTLSNGTHTLTAVAQDAAGNRGTSAGVVVSVANPAGTPATVALVQQAVTFVGGGSTSISQSFTKVSTTGDLIVATVKWGGQNLALASVTDNHGNVYQTAAGPTNWSGTAKASQTVFAKNISGGGAAITITVRLSGASTGNLHLYQFEYSGADAAAPVDAARASVGTGTGISAGSLTTLANNDLIHAATFTDSGTTSAGTGFKALTTFDGNLVENRSVGGAGTYGATATSTGGGNWFIHALALKPGAGGGATGDAATLPTVSLTAPAGGATVSGAVTVSANATDNVGVASVQFQLDGANLGSLDTAAPYSVSWDTTTVGNGSHTLRAIAKDAANNSATSASVTVQVNNSVTPPAVALPLKASANRRYLVDQNNVPFLLMGDASHALLSAINTTDMATYMSARAGQGFNAIQVFAPCDTYETNCVASMASFSGVVPFTSGSSQTDYDLATPNPAYWALLDNLLAMAAAHNLVVFLNPLETGGLLPLFEHNGTNKVFNYGVFLGNRYKNTPNIVWDFGNDFQNWRNAPGDNNLVSQLMAGIASVDANHLMDIELDYDRSYSSQDSTLVPSLSLNAAYTYFETYDCVLAAYNSAPTMPVYMIEANYEFQNNTGFLPGNTGTLVLREQEYWTMTSGATGQFYGSFYTNHFNSGWQSHLNSPGALEIVFLTQLFRSLPWWNLVPDQTHQVVTAGFGTSNGSSGNLPASTYATTTWVPDGSLAVVYNPAGSALTVNLAKFSGAVTARWYDPSNGTYTAISGSPFANSGSHVFSTPGKNHDTASDWVLVLQ